LRRAAFPYMQQLVERFNETCDLGIFFIGVGVSWWVRIQARSVDCTAVGIRRKVLVEVACCKMEGLRSGLSLGESQTYEEERNETEIYRRRELLIPEHQAR
jgi:hypothetical protein